MALFQTLLFPFLAAYANTYSLPNQNWNINCRNSDISDNYWDLACMTKDCDFDGYENPHDGTWISDCKTACKETGCDVDNQWGKNGCDAQCNSAAWGWDMGECGACNSGCTESMLGDGSCDDECNGDNCIWDHGDCGYWAFGCAKNMLSEQCWAQWNTYNCVNTLDFLESCLTSEWATGCSWDMISNYTCDTACQTPECAWDGNLDCWPCDDGCPDTLRFNDTVEKAWCTADWGWDNGKWGDCAPGCFQSHLENGVWDEQCNVEACDYDVNACLCENECLLSMNNNDTCNYQCLTPDCLYDFSYGSINDHDLLKNPPFQKHDGISKPYDCSEEQVKVAIAYQILKNDFHARWQPEKWPCSIEILLNDSCENACNIEAWVFDMGRCSMEQNLGQDKMEGKFDACQIRTPGDPDGCAMSSICIKANWLYCYETGTHQGQICLLCDIFNAAANVYQLYDRWVSECPSMLKPHPTIPKLCTSKQIDIDSHPDLTNNLVVSATYTGLEEDGSDQKPYKNVATALASIWAINSTISLLKGTHYFEDYITSNYPNSFSSPPEQPLTSQVTKNINQLTITSYLCSDAPKWNGSEFVTHENINGQCIDNVQTDDRPLISLKRMWIQLLIQYNTVISNVNITTEKAINADCAKYWCTYCPLMTNTEGEVITKTNVRETWDANGDFCLDQGQCYSRDEAQAQQIPIMLPSGLTDCWNNQFGFMEVSTGIKLKLENVEFYKIQIGYAALIHLKGNAQLEMNNVNFVRVSSKFVDCTEFFQCVQLLSSAVIYAEPCVADNEYSCASIDWTGGKVELLNYGFEYHDSLEQTGFLHATNLVHLKLEDIIFSYNVIWNSNPIALIFLSDFLEFTMIDCTFEYNFATQHALIYIENDMNFFPRLDGAVDFIPDNVTHILIDGCVFRSNGSHHGSLMQISFLSMIQNIDIKNCEFSSNISIESPLLNFENNANVADPDPAGTQHIRSAWIEGEVINVIDTTTTATRQKDLAPRFFNFTDNVIQGNVLGQQGALSISKLANVWIHNLKNEDNHNNMDDIWPPISNIVFYAHKQNANAYVKKGYDEFTNTPFQCQQNIFLTENQRVNITDSLFKNNTIHEVNGETGYSSGIRFTSTAENDVIQISKVAFEDNNAFAKVSGLIIEVSTDIQLSELTFSNGNSALYGAMYIENKKTYDVNITDSTFTNNRGVNSAALQISAGAICLHDITFVDNSAIGVGGALGCLNQVNEQVSLTIEKCVFRGNSAFVGGAISIQDNSVDGTLWFDIEGSTFEENTAVNVAILGIDNTVSLSGVTSTIRDCTFTNNQADPSYGIVIQTREGGITIENCEFSQNKGVSGVVLSLATSSTITIKNSSISNNIGGSIINLENSITTQNIEIQDTTFSGNQGSVIYSNGAAITEIRNKYVNNSNKEGACLLLNQSTLAASYITYESNTATENGGAVFVRTKSEYKCEYCTITDNSAKSGGFAYGEIDSKVDIMHSRLSKNFSALKGSVLMLNTCKNNSQFINNTVYENEVGYAGTLYLIKSSIAINDTIMHDNSETSKSAQTPGISSILSTIGVYNSEFYNQHATGSGSVFYVSTESKLIVEKSKITNCSSGNSGGALFCLASTVEIFDSTITGVSSERDGGFALVNQASYLEIASSTSITSAYAASYSIVAAYDSELKLLDSSFQNFNNTGIFGNSLSALTIENCSFIDSISVYYSGGAINCDRWEEITITNTQFTNNTAPYGGAIYLTSERTLVAKFISDIQSNDFYLNRANQGGAIMAANTNIKVYSNSFSNNTAGFVYDIMGTTEENESGGAARLVCSPQAQWQYDLDKNTFIGNQGLNSGGAVSWDGSEPSGLTNNTYSNNAASYGSSIASYATHLVAVDENGIPIGRRHLQEESSLTELSNVQSGSENGLVIRAALTDDQGEVITNDNASTATLMSNNAGVSLSGVLQVTAQSGIFVFDAFKIVAQPGSKVSFQIQTNAIELEKENVSNNEFDIAVELRECVLGEVLAASACETCALGTYSLDLDDPYCQECYSDAACPGGWYIVPDKGFWRPHDLYDGIFECPNFDACLGSSNATESLTGECNTGYTGNMCQACDQNYSRGGSNTWLKCLDKEVNAVRLFCTAIAMVIITAIMVKTSMKAAYKPKDIHSIYIKIFLNYLQLVLLTESFDLNWPDYILDMREAHETAGSAGDHIISFDCYFMGEGDDAGIDVYFDKLMLWAVLPAALILINFIIWGTVAAIKRNRRVLKREAMTTMVILYFLIHPDLIKTFFFAMSCREIESGEKWLVVNLDVLCWEGDHHFYAVTVIIPSVIVWGCGLPILFLGTLYKNRLALHKFSLKAKYGFLYIGYDLTSYFWEFIILYRKILIVAILVFSVQWSTNVAALCCLIVLIISLHLQHRVQPFEKQVLNDMETRSILVATMTLYCGLFYLTEDINEVVKIVLLIAMIIVNLYFLLFWLWKMFGAYLNVARDKIPCLTKCLGQNKLVDGYGDELTVDSVQPAHYWQHGKETRFSLVPNLKQEDYTEYKAVKIPDTMTDLAVVALQQCKKRDLKVSDVLEDILPVEPMTVFTGLGGVPLSTEYSQNEDGESVNLIQADMNQSTPIDVIDLSKNSAEDDD